MPMTLAELKKEVMTFPREEQLRLAQDIFQLPVSEIEQAWYKEIERRVETIKSGKAKLIPAEEVFDRAFKMLNKKASQK